MHIWAVLLAAGRGSRLASPEKTASLPPKQFLSYKGQPLFWHSAHTMAGIAELSGIVFVFPPALHSIPCVTADTDSTTDAMAFYENCLKSLDSGGSLGLAWRVALGGERRQDSVANGLARLPKDCTHVLIHDSARPFAAAPLIMRVINGLKQGYEGVIPGIQVTDTIKRVDERHIVQDTPERRTLRAVQTPQGFVLGTLRNAHRQAQAEKWTVTDDASLLERCGKEVLVVEGEETNRKITTPGDLALLKETTATPPYGCGDYGSLPCSGLGYDVHRYGGERPFILGGVPIATDVTIAAHSDGDTLLHALMDALLGCIGGGDIGGLFPDSDPAYDNISSGVLLAEVLDRVEKRGLRITCVDITVIAQTPRIAPHREAITANLAKLLSLPRSYINVKATTEERLGFTGEKKGIKVLAQVTGLKPTVEDSACQCS